MKKFFAGMSVMAVTATMLSGMAFADGIKTIKVEKLKLKKMQKLTGTKRQNLNLNFRQISSGTKKL